MRKEANPSMGGLCFSALIFGIASLANPASASTPQIPKLAVLEVEATAAQLEGLDRSALTELFTGGLEDPRFRIVTTRDIVAMLGLEQSKRLMGCEEESCLAEIAGALGADLLASASVGVLSGSFVLAGRIVDTRRAVVLARSSFTFDDEKQLLNEMKKLGTDLRERYFGAREEGAKTSSFPSDWNLVPGVYSGVVYAPGDQRIGGEVEVALQMGNGSVALGMHVAPNLGARAAATWDFLARDSFRLGLGIRAIVTPMPDSLLTGGGLGLGIRYRLASWLDGTMTAAGEVHRTPSETSFVPLVTSGLLAHLSSTP